MIRIVLPLVSLMLAGACAPQGRPGAVPGVQCNAGPAERLIGKAESAEVAAEAKRLSGAKVLRWIRPDMMVTMEFRPDRLNLHLGTDGKIGSVRCG
jgi:hypothetical protein